MLIMKISHVLNSIFIRILRAFLSCFARLGSCIRGLGKRSQGLSDRKIIGGCILTLTEARILG